MHFNEFLCEVASLPASYSSGRKMSALTVFSDGTELEEIVRCTVDKERREVRQATCGDSGVSGNVLSAWQANERTTLVALTQWPAHLHVVRLWSE